MIFFKLEINLLISKLKEIEKYKEKEILREKIYLLNKKKIKDKEKFLGKTTNPLKDENKINFEEDKKANHLVKPSIMKKNIILHKKTKLLNNRYFNSITGQMLDNNDIDLLSNEFLTFEVEKDHLNERDHKVNLYN